MTDFPELPDFLRATGPGTRIAIKAKTKRTKRNPFHLPRNIEPAGIALLKQVEREKVEKQKARLAALKELRKR